MGKRDDGKLQYVHYAGKPRYEKADAEARAARAKAKAKAKPAPSKPKPVSLRAAKAANRPVRVAPPDGRIRMQRHGRPPGEAG